MRTGRRTLQVVATRQRRETRPDPTLRVRVLSARATTGWLEWGSLRFRCALGRAGRKAIKREGDGASPIGVWRLRQAWFRADRLVRPQTGLDLRAIRPRDGWCDAACDPNYNRPITHPYPASAEHLWRTDGLYDIVVALGYNDYPRVRGRGSAIFLHCASEGFAPTQGCIALARGDLTRLLARLGRGARVRV